MTNLKILYQGVTYPAKTFTFPGGEAHLKLPGWTDKVYDKAENLIEKASREATVFCRMQTPGSLVDIMLAADVVKRELWRGGLGAVALKLAVPYLPYARQDRVIEPDEPFSLKVFLNIVTSQFMQIETYDVHNLSAVGHMTSYLSETSQLDIIQGYPGLVNWILENRPIIVAPDKGSFHKAGLVANHFGLPLITADKSRDHATGKVVRMTVPSADLVKGRHALIVDDLCDGGRTFTELAGILRTHAPLSVALYVTHGIFSRGYDVFTGLIDRIYTTNTFIPAAYPVHPQVPVFIHAVVEEDA